MMAELFFSFWLFNSWFSVDVYHYNDTEYQDTEITINYTWEF